MSYHHSDPSRENDPYALPDVEVFYVPIDDQTEDTIYWDDGADAPMGEGWYYWFCAPGYMPMGDALYGPYKSEEAAERSFHVLNTSSDSEEALGRLAFYNIRPTDDLLILRGSILRAYAKVRFRQPRVLISDVIDQWLRDNPDKSPCQA